MVRGISGRLQALRGSAGGCGSPPQVKPAASPEIVRPMGVERVSMSSKSTGMLELQAPDLQDLAVDATAAVCFCSHPWWCL